MFGNLRAALDAQNQGATLQSKKPPIYQSEVWGLIDGESIVVRFQGGAGEPHIFHQHGLARHPEFGFEKAICCKPENCLACNAAVPGEKRVKRASPYAAFTVFSTRQILLVPYTRDDGTTGVSRRPLRQDVHGTYIDKSPNSGQVRPLSETRLAEIRDYETVAEGLKSWCGSLTLKANNAARLLQLDMDLQKRCQCGQKVGQGLGARPASIEIIEGEPRCTANCGDPKQGSLTACYVQITRRGVGTDTTYDFSPLPFSSPEPEHEMGNISLAELYAPDPEKVARQLRARGINLTPNTATDNTHSGPSTDNLFG